MVNTNHNKYISIPDWFTESNSKTSNIVDGQDYHNNQIFFPQYNSNKNKWDVLLYNKFVLSSFEYSNEILTIKDTAIISKNNLSSLGSTIDDTEWSASDYMPIASGSNLVINSSKHNEYGIAFYDRQHIALSGKNFTEYDYTIIVPNSACYFRICCKNSFTGFFVKGFTARNYDKDELTLSDKNTNNYLQLNSEIPEGISKVRVDGDSLQLLVQNPLQLSKDDNNVIKLSLDYYSLMDSLPIATYNSAGIASFDSNQFILDNGNVSINDNWLGQVQNDIGFNLYSSDEYEIK